MGPLDGIRVLEIAGIGPAPFGAMLLADMGAEVVRVDRPGEGDLGLDRSPAADLLNRGKRSIALDLKAADGAATVLRLADRADVLVEGFRPGVAERLGIGPEVCLARNPRLVYGRMTGWGQDGPLAHAAGHDINYIALSGALDAIGPAGGPPVPPLNLVGDFGGGGMLLAVGVLAALVERGISGRGQVVDAAILDGAALQMAAIQGLRASGHWSGGRGGNVLDGGAPFYGVYETADGGFISIGPIEARFRRQLAGILGIAETALGTPSDRAAWQSGRKTLEAIFRTRTRDDWCALLEGTDVCFAPVLSLEEVPDHPHHVARGTYVERDGVAQPAPAPRFGRTPGAIAGPPPKRGGDGRAVLADWGIPDDEVEALAASGVLAVG